MPVNLLRDPIFTTNLAGKLSLPGLLEGVARGEVSCLPKIPAHQVTLFHSFLCQLAAIVATRHFGSTLPQDAGEWRNALLKETGGRECLWELITPIDQPGFMQVSISEEEASKGKIKSYVGGIDILFDSKNHSRKIGEGANCSHEEWVYALVAAQTGAGYGGAGHYGSVRLRGGPSSRPFMGLVPTDGKDKSIHISKWVQRDVEGIIRKRSTNDPDLLEAYSRQSLMWTDDWDGTPGAIKLCDLDPHFIEACKRIKLVDCDGEGVGAYLLTTKGRRVEIPKGHKGHGDDPWAPAEIITNTSDDLAEMAVINPGERQIDYRMVMDLVMNERRYVKPFLADLQENEDVSLLIEFTGRGDGKTFGHHSRMINLPQRILNAFDRPGMGEKVNEMLTFIKDAENIARGAFTLYFYGGDHDRREAARGMKGRPDPLKAALAVLGEDITRKIDRRFFFHLSRVADETRMDAGSFMMNEFKEWVSSVVLDETEYAFSRFPRSINTRIRADAKASQELYLRMNKHLTDMAA